MDNVTFTFECGCFTMYYVDSTNELRGGLSCCQKHEAPYQEIGKILPLVLVDVTHGYKPLSAPDASSGGAATKEEE